MANEISTSANTVWRDYATDGVPSSGAHEPVKADIRSHGAVVQTQVDAAVALVAIGVQVKDAVRVATTTNGTLATAFQNGVTVDGVTLATNDRILLKDQTAGAENGIYVVAASGTPTRATDADADAEIPGARAYVQEGTANGGTTWYCNNATVTVGSTALTFALVGDESSVESTVNAAVALAQKWAEEVENTPVTGAQFSALHWAAKAQGYASSTPDIRNTDPLTASNTTPALEGSDYVVRYDVTQTVRENSAKNASASQPWPNTLDHVHVCWEPADATKCVLPAGVLTEVEIALGIDLDLTGSPTIQVWVMRCTDGGFPATPASGAITFNLVHKVGEVDLSSAPESGDLTTAPLKFKSLNLDVQANDVIAVRGIDAGIRYFTNSGGATDYNVVSNLSVVVANATLEAFDAATLSGTVATTFTRLWHITTTVDSSNKGTLARDGYGSPLRLGADGYIPVTAVRQNDAPWAGKTVLVCGTSIETASGGGDSGATGWVTQIEAMLQCTIDNEAVGSSMISWVGNQGGGGDLYSLSATAAELTGAGGSASYSYENKIVGKGADLLILAHGINDRNRYSTVTVGAIAAGPSLGGSAFDKSTFIGAYQHVIEAALTDDPELPIVIATMPHRWSSYTTGTPSENAQADNFYDAQIAVAEYYCLPVIDFYKELGVSNILLKLGEVDTAVGLYDTIHPAQHVKNRQAQIAYGVLKNL